jgi:hypothetical protein
MNEQEEDEDLSPDFMKKFICLKWDCLPHGVSLASLECPFPKPYIYEMLKEYLDMHEIYDIMLSKWRVHVRRSGL